MEFAPSFCSMSFCIFHVDKNEEKENIYKLIENNLSRIFNNLHEPKLLWILHYIMIEFLFALFLIGL